MSQKFSNPMTASVPVFWATQLRAATTREALCGPRLFGFLFTSVHEDTENYGPIRGWLVKRFASKISTTSPNELNVRYWHLADMR